MIALLGLLACGAEAPLDQPNPPPAPPPSLTLAEPDIVTLEGTVTEVSASTRTWIMTGEGKRQLCFLIANAALDLNGQPALVGDLPVGATLTVEGRTEGDLLLVRSAIVKAAAATGSDPGAPIPTVSPLTPTVPTMRAVPTPGTPQP